MPRLMLPPSGRKVSTDDAHREIPANSRKFEVTVVGAIGLCGVPAWSRGHGWYLTLTIGGEQIHKTNPAGIRRDPQWNETVQFVAKCDDDVCFGIYTVDCDALLGEVEESLVNVDCTGEDMVRRVSSTQAGKSFTLAFRFEPRIFGLVIGIDKYTSQDIPDLQGCKTDAQSMVDLLSRKFRVPSWHLLCLTDERATRSAIITGFQKHLIQNNDIEGGDAIVIFYAGHGSRISAPKGWVADYNQVETICPHDERTTNHDGKEIFSIPDRTLGGLLRKLSSIKGDNITVIFDSCHSGGISRNDMVPRAVKSTSRLPEDLDKDIWIWGLPRTTTAAGFLDQTMSSHVLLAACRHNEVAFENPSGGEITRGAFTRDLVKLLYRQRDLTQVTYSGLINMLPPLERQHPQCGGKNKGRTIFSGAVGAYRPIFELAKDHGTYRAEAGDIHGVVEGTLFAIHAHDDTTSVDLELGILEADVVSPNSCTLRRRREEAQFDIPPGASALVLNWRQKENMLKVFVEPPLDVIQPMEDIFTLADVSSDADLVVRHTSGGKLQCERLDPLMSKYSRVLNNIPAQPALSDVLRGVAHFNFHLSRRNIANPLEQEVEVVLHRLTQSNPEQIKEEPIYVPDGLLDMHLVLDRENTVYIPKKATMAYNSNRVFYGLTIKNNSGRNLFPYLIYFDPSDYSIQSWYHPPSDTMAAPLSRRGDKSSELPVGYGSGDKAVAFTLADGVTADVGFMKLFVSTTYVNMTVLEQASPFGVRGAGMEKLPIAPIWDAWTYVLRTEEK